MTDELPCHEGSGSTNDMGYRYTYLAHRDGVNIRIASHRKTYAEAIGLLALGPVIAHSCDNTGCDEPSHLFATDQAGNLRDVKSKGRTRNQHSGRTECMRGHPYVEGSYRVQRNGWRTCIVCERIRRKRWSLG